MITAALAAIGLSSRLGQLRKAGFRPVLLGAILWATVGLSSPWPCRWPPGTLCDPPRDRYRRGWRQAKSSQTETARAQCDVGFLRRGTTGGIPCSSGLLAGCRQVVKPVAQGRDGRGSGPHVRTAVDDLRDEVAVAAPGLWDAEHVGCRAHDGGVHASVGHFRGPTSWPKLRWCWTSTLVAGTGAGWESGTT